MIVSGAQIVSRAFITAYQQALRSTFFLVFDESDPPVLTVRFLCLTDAKAGGGAAAAGSATGVVRRRLATDEALKILNMERSELTAEAVQKVSGDAAGAGALVTLPDRSSHCPSSAEVRQAL